MAPDTDQDYTILTIGIHLSAVFNNVLTHPMIRGNWAEPGRCIVGNDRNVTNRQLNNDLSSLTRTLEKMPSEVYRIELECP